MREVLDAFWRAALSCVHPRVVLWSLLPLSVAGTSVAVLGWLYWESAVAAVRAALEQWALIAALLKWLEAMGGGAFRAVVAPMVVVALALPLVVLLSLLAVAWLMTPALVSWVASRRFVGLQRRGAALAWGQSLLWSLGCTVLAMGVLVLSLPLWFVPPLAAVIPPLVWGWLAARLFAFDTLASHATAVERRFILHHKRYALLGMGVACGLFGSLPSLLWAMGALTLVFAPLVALVSVWMYTLVFAFASMWFAHFTLGQLQRLRALEASASAAADPINPTPALPGAP